MGIATYQQHAAVWDWDGYDKSGEYAYWCDYAVRYGKNILVPMCALGEVGEYIAERGFTVTAFDITEEMIEEGKKRFGDIRGLHLAVGDICTYASDNAPFDFIFLKDQDLHLLPSMKTVTRAFENLYTLLRTGGALVLELTLPGDDSLRQEKRIFHPRSPRNPGKKIWKEHESFYNADTKINHIRQTVFVQEQDVTTQFLYSVDLHYYERGELLEALAGSGFTVTGEFQNRARKPWKPGSLDLIVEAVRSEKP